MRRPRKSAFFPVSGCVRTIGCRAPGTRLTSSTFSNPLCALPALECVVGGIAIEERGRAAGARRRHFEGAQQAGCRRHIDERAVGVPERLAVAEAADCVAVFDDVGDHRDLRWYFALTADGLRLDPVLPGDQRRGLNSSSPN